MLIGTITLNSTEYNISESGYADTKYYDPYILGFVPPNYSTGDICGGFCELTFGSISLSPDLFDNEWPPPINGELILKYTDTTEAAATVLFEGMAHLNERAITIDSIEYDIYGKNYDTDLLSETTDYDENEDIPIPKAFGTIQHQTPLRIADVSDLPTYHKSNLSGGLAKTFTAIADNGSGNCRITCNNHEYSTSNNITIEGTDRQYNGTYLITVIDSNTFDIDKAYVSTTTGHAYNSTQWRVYDDGVPISCNVTDNGNDTFSLSASPVGEITISGIGDDETLVDLFNSACVSGSLNLTCDTTKARVTSPTLGYWADSQTLLIDFLSNVSAYSTHLFYISGSTLYLMDMSIDNGARTIDEFEFFTSTHMYNPPIKQIDCTLITKTDVEETIGKYVKEDTQDITQMSPYHYGDVLNITPYQSNRDDIITTISGILDLVHLPRVSIDIPLQAELPMPGERISWTNASLHIPTDVYIRCRNIRYDPLNDIISIDGEGGLSTA